MNGESRGTACLAYFWKWMKSDIESKLIVSLCNYFPLRRGGFELDMSKEANLQQQTDFTIEDQANIWIR